MLPMGRGIFPWAKRRSSGVGGDNLRYVVSRFSVAPIACAKALNAIRIWRRCAAVNWCRWPSIR
ncbi:hypothetical protein D3C84_1223380 [compost metagenome]